MTLLITGGAGYIGAHIAYGALEEGYKVTIFDDLSSGHFDNIPSDATFIQGSTLSIPDLTELLNRNSFDSVIHLAACKSAGESMLKPEIFSRNNLIGAINLINLCSENNIKNFIFSSSAAVYGRPKKNPVEESDPLQPTNYYGFTKLIIENNLKWFSKLKKIRYASLRYFNAAGYDLLKRISNVERNPQNLIPSMMEVAIGMKKKVRVYGNDYNTRDGTGIRDYIHVSDLAKAHLDAIQYLHEKNQDLTVNLGTGVGYTVFEVLKEIEEVTKIKLDYSIDKRRDGDMDVLIAKSDLAKDLINWNPKSSDIKTIISSTWEVYKIMRNKKEEH